MAHSSRVWISTGLVSCAAIAAAWGGLASFHASQPRLHDADQDRSAEPSQAEEDPRAAEDARLRRVAVGTWHDEYQGKRTMTLREDGTGTMVVELSGMKASLVASRLRFDMVWSVEQGRLKKRSLGGEPAAQVRLILKAMGDQVDEPILELSEDRLLLLDRDGTTRYDWRRG